MATVYTSQKSRKVIVSYICSHCKSLITMEGELNAIGRSQNKAHAQAAADKAFEDALYSIKEAGKKPFLVRKLYEFEDEVARNSVNAFQFFQLEKSCAYCGHHELWQNPNDKGLTYDGVDWSGKLRVNSIKGVPEDSCPHFLDSDEVSKKIRFDYLEGTVRNAVEYWKENPEKAAELNLAIENYQKMIDSLQEKLRNLNGPCDQLRSKIDDKMSEANNYSFLSGERRALNKEIKSLEKQFKALEKESSDLSFNLKNQIVEVKNKKKKLLIDNFGVTGDLNTYNVSENPFYQIVRLD